MPPISVAVDTGPLVGPRTGVGVAVAGMVDALEDHPEVHLRRYVLSARARSDEQVARLPLPAAAALRLWRHGAAWTAAIVDRALGPVDIVHGTNYVVPPSRHRRVVSVYDVWFLLNPGAVRADVRRRGAVLERNVADGVLVHSTSSATTAALTRRWPDARVVTVPLAAVPLPAPSARPPLPAVDGRPYVLFTGTLERRKNVPALVSAFGRLALDHPEVHLVLAGADGDDVAAIDREVLQQRSDVAMRIHRTGWVSGADRSHLLRHASAVAYPSLDEGFGFPLLDAMQAEVPIVASDAGSIPEVAGDAALLSPPDDLETLAVHLAAALEPTVATRLTVAGTERVQHYSWQRTAAGLLAAYRAELDGSDPTG